MKIHIYNGNEMFKRIMLSKYVTNLKTKILAFNCSLGFLQLLFHNFYFYFLFLFLIYIIDNFIFKCVLRHKNSIQ